jgi:hypothetical protein
MDELTGIQTWYLDQCDGDWEHDWGVRIGTLDNPGWDVQINVAGTPLEGVPFPAVEDLGPEDDWIHCWVDGNAFKGVGGPLMLQAILRHFLEWARASSRRPA